MAAANSLIASVDLRGSTRGKSLRFRHRDNVSTDCIKAAWSNNEGKCSQVHIAMWYGPACGRSETKLEWLFRLAASRIVCTPASHANS